MLILALAMCSWAVSTVVEHYNIRGEARYGAALDCSKAFNMVELLELFKDWKNTDISPVFLPILLHIYSHQRCDVRWNSHFSSRFPVTNGCRQGAVTFGIFLCASLRGCVKLGRDAGSLKNLPAFSFIVTTYSFYLQAVPACSH